MKPLKREQLEAFILAGGTWRDLQKQYLVAVLSMHDGNRTHAAKAAGLSLRTVTNQIRRFGLQGIDAKTES